jgi:hypothetical protein
MHDRTRARARRCARPAILAAKAPSLTVRPIRIAPILTTLLATACAPNGDTGPEPYAGPPPLDLYLQAFTRAEYDAGTVPLAGDLLSLHSCQAEQTQCAPATWTTADGVLVIVGATGPHYRALWLR